MPTVYPPSDRIMNKGICCCRCPEYFRLDAAFPAAVPYTQPPQKIDGARLTCYNSSGVDIATYQIGYATGETIEEYQTGFEDVPVYDGGKQIGTLTWVTENTDTSIFGHKDNQGTLIFKIDYGEPAAEYPPAEQTVKREPAYNCTYRAEGVTINRYAMTGLNIAGDVTQ